MLVDIPKDVFQAQGHYAPVTSIHLPGYKVFTEGHTGQIRRAAQMIWEAERPLVYAGGGIIAANASDELREFVELLDAPAVCTLMGLGALPAEHPNFISMPGMHGSYAANMGMTERRPADRAGRALRRPRHRPAGRLCAARQGDPRRYRSRRRSARTARRIADRGRREARAAEAEQGSWRNWRRDAATKNAAARQRVVEADPRLEGRASAAIADTPTPRSSRST